MFERRLEPYDLYEENYDYEPVPLSDFEIEELYELFEQEMSDETLNHIYNEVVK